MLTRVYAQGVGTNVSNPLERFDSLAAVFGVAMNVIMGVAVSLSVIFLGLGGIKYITAKGDAKAAEEARTWLTNAVIGLIITLGALAVKTIVLDSILDADISSVDANLVIDGAGAGSTE
ncbi:hypothetical protein GF360_00685 [candidate division WWE3 bacterium]|nr:hypothetical protein [candidate division WWE3 bacterium]